MSAMMSRARTTLSISPALMRVIASAIDASQSARSRLPRDQVTEVGAFGSAFTGESSAGSALPRPIVVIHD